MYRDVLARPPLARYLCPPLRVRQHRPSPEARTARVSAARCSLTNTVLVRPRSCLVWFGVRQSTSEKHHVKLEYFLFISTSNRFIVT